MTAFENMVKDIEALIGLPFFRLPSYDLDAARAVSDILKWARINPSGRPIPHDPFAPNIGCMPASLLNYGSTVVIPTWLIGYNLNSAPREAPKGRVDFATSNSDLAPHYCVMCSHPVAERIARVAARFLPFVQTDDDLQPANRFQWP